MYIHIYIYTIYICVCLLFWLPFDPTTSLGNHGMDMSMLTTSSIMTLPNVAENDTLSITTSSTTRMVPLTYPLTNVMLSHGVSARPFFFSSCRKRPLGTSFFRYSTPPLSLTHVQQQITHATTHNTCEYKHISHDANHDASHHMRL